VTGSFVDATALKIHGFVRDQNGHITVFDPPHSALTDSNSINDSGNVTGVFLDASRNNKERGFVRSIGIGPPTNKDQCKDGGWKIFTIPRKFKNQGGCVSFVNTGK
jgi:hypothetical protein